MRASIENERKSPRMNVDQRSGAGGILVKMMNSSPRARFAVFFLFGPVRLFYLIVRFGLFKISFTPGLDWEMDPAIGPFLFFFWVVDLTYLFYLVILLFRVYFYLIDLFTY